MFHLLAYEESVGASTNTELDAVADETFQIGVSGFRFFEQWMAIQLAYQATSAVRARSNVPFINAINRHHIFPINRSATVPSNPQVQDLRDYPFVLPRNEEFNWESFTDQATGNEASRVFMWIAPPTWSKQLPPHIQRLTVRATASAAGTADSWGAFGALTLSDQDLRGGVYAVVGAQVFDAGSIAFRFNFGRAPYIQGRKLRPGGLCMEALANIPLPQQMGGQGVWGLFHTFELPTIQVFANASAASAQEIRLDLLYLGEDENLLRLAA